MEQGNVPDLDLISQIPGEDLSAKTMEQPESLSQQSTDSSAIPNNTNNEPHSQPDSSELATHEESSTRSSVFHETDDSDDDPVLVPGARYRGGVGHRLVLCLFSVFKNLQNIQISPFSCWQFALTKSVTDHFFISSFTLPLVTVLAFCMYLHSTSVTLLNIVCSILNLFSNLLYNLVHRCMQGGILSQFPNWII